MAQHAVRRPLAEPRLHDEDRLDPAALLGRFRLCQLHEGRRIGFQRGEEAGDAVELGVGESGSDLSREDERPGRRSTLAGGVVAEEEGAEVRARSARQGPAADHELLGARELHLPPTRTAVATGVAPVGALDDDSLPGALQAAVRQRSAVAGRALDQAHRLRAVRAQQAFQPPPAFGERKRPEILVPVAQQVEDDERGRHVAYRRAHGAARRVQPLLEVLKRQRRAVPAGRHDLAVQQHGTAQPAPEHGQRLDQIGKLRGLVAAEPRVQTGGRRAVQRHQGPHAVVLWFEDELGSREQTRVSARAAPTRPASAARHAGRRATPSPPAVAAPGASPWKLPAYGNPGARPADIFREGTRSNERWPHVQPGRAT